ncbi:hypothetical protein ACI8AF_11165 [Blastococcus sp. SYSU D00669]
MRELSSRSRTRTDIPEDPPEDEPVPAPTGWVFAAVLGPLVVLVVLAWTMRGL